MQTEAMTHSLSAAEILLLLNPSAPAREAFKVALKELVALGHVRLQGQQVSFPPVPAPQNPALASVLSAVRPLSGAVTLEAALRQAQGQFGGDYARLKGKTLLPALVGRGLLEVRRGRALGVFPTARHVHTAEGARRKRDLEGQVQQAKRVGELLRDDPAQAAALVLSLGAAAVLVPQVWEHFGQINGLMRQYEGSSGAEASYFGAADDERLEEAGGFEGSFSALDSGVDASSGGDGGGDGGGGGE